MLILSLSIPYPFLHGDIMPFVSKWISFQLSLMRLMWSISKRQNELTFLETSYLWWYAILQRSKKACTLRNCYPITNINHWELFWGARASVLLWNPVFYGYRTWIRNCYRVGKQRAVRPIVRAIPPEVPFLDDLRSSFCSGLCFAAS